MNIEKRVKELIHRLYPGATLEKLSGGHHNLNFKVTSKSTTVVFRAPKEKDAESIATTEKEAVIMRQLRGALSPTLVTVHHVGNLPVVETHFISGAHKNLSSLKKQELEQLGRTIAILHSVRKRKFDPGFTTFGKYSGTHLDYFTRNVHDTITKHQKHYRKNQLVLTALQKLRDELQPRLFFRKTFSLTHGDLWQNNIIWNKLGIYLIDWSDGRYADPADELAYIKAINNIRNRHVHILTDEYMRHTADPDVLKRMPSYELKNRIFDVVWALRKVNNANTQSEKRRYQPLYNVRAKNLEGFLRDIN